ncbi:MATE family efflux transporter [candidate division WOR-3 bacterium]|uniref:Multidrug export protein MepA n=1 Tax=candidate division WOR-3 bacterium TaxID=2052148 RepID=A0A9D5QEB3_UNCW3|nr:MATE family efflux transporter [candidate division WOR-3 bacterium]MBD3364875.1 MATE family efflux transporter [candidate division WOR-3 bacterium]
MPNHTSPRRSELMGTQSVGKLLWRFSLPGVIGMLVNATYNLIDTIFVGGLGPDAIASVTVVFPIQMVMIAIGAGTGIGAASLISRRLGEKRIDEANVAVGQTLGLVVIVGALMALFGSTLGRPLLSVMGASENIIGDAYSYMIVITSGAVIMFANIIGNNLIRAEGNPVLPMIAMITGAVINMGLDPLFIYVFKMGVQGAAVATITARGLASILVLGYLLGGKTDYRIKISQFIPRLKVWGQIYAVGGPHMLMSLVGSVSMGVSIRIAAMFGDQYIAAYGILFRVMQYGFMPCIGIAQGALPIIGYNFGARKPLRVRHTVIKAALVSTAITLGISAIAIIFPEAIVKLFLLFQKVTEGTQVAGAQSAEAIKNFRELASYAVRIAFIGFTLVGSQVIFATFFQGIGKALPAALISISRQLLLLVPALLLLAFLVGKEAIWFAAPIADVGSFIISAIWTYATMCKLGIGLWGKCKSPHEVTS